MVDSAWNRLRGISRLLKGKNNKEGDESHLSLLEQKVGYLSEMELFQDLAQEDLDWLDRVTSMVVYPRGKLIYSPKEPREVLFLLKRGKVQLYRISPEGKKLIVTTLNKSTFFGEIALLSQGMYGSFAEAAEDSLVCIMDRQVVAELILRRPQVGLRIVYVLSRRLLQLEQVLEDMNFKRVPARLASLLLSLGEGEEKKVIMGLTHQDLADMLGALRETVSECLNRFRAQGLVEIERMKITILKPEALTEIANE